MKKSAKDSRALAVVAIVIILCAGAILYIRQGSLDRGGLVGGFMKDAQVVVSTSGISNKFTTASDKFVELVRPGTVDQSLADISEHFAEHRVNVKCPLSAKDNPHQFISDRGPGEVTVCGLSYYGKSIGKIWLAKGSLSYGPETTIARLHLY